MPSLAKKRMKTDETLKTFERRLWLRGILIGLGGSIVAYFIGIFLNKAMPGEALNSLALSSIFCS
jgi:hypothetical protein